MEDLAMPSTARYSDRSGPARMSRAFVGAGINEKPNDLHVTVRNRFVKRCPAFVVRPAWRRPAIEQHAYGGGMPAACSLQQWRYAAFTARVNRSRFAQEECDNRGMAFHGSRMERRITAAVAEVNGCSGRD